MKLTTRLQPGPTVRGLAVSALLASALGLAACGGVQGAGAAIDPDAMAPAGAASVRLWAPANNLQAGALAMDSLRLLLDRITAALAGDTAACAGGAASLCALLPTGANAQGRIAVLGGCELDGATPLCRIELVTPAGGAARTPPQRLELAWQRGRWVARDDTRLAAAQDARSGR